MTRLITLLGAALALYTTTARGQEISLEYRVKAAYLFNFTKFVEWPADPATSEPLTICLASRNPFGAVLDELIRDERVNGRPLRARVVQEPAGCDVLFIPKGVGDEAYLRAARGRPTLTVGETADFLRHGGIVNFVIEEGKVRFDIDRSAALRANLTISSRLLRLARAAISAITPQLWHAE